MYIKRKPAIVQFKIIERLCQARGGFVSADDIVEHVYADDPDGGPLDARGSIRGAVYKLRRRGYPIRLVSRGYCHGAWA